MHRLSLIAAALTSVSVAALASETITYSYDARGRLLKASHTGSVNDGLSTSYVLDKADNRVSKTTTGGAAGTGSPSTGGGAGTGSTSPDNLSFEQPDVGSGLRYQPADTGFTFGNGTGVAGNGSPFGFEPAPDGDQVAFLQSGPGGTPGGISRTLAGLSAGGFYKLSFRLAQRANYARNDVVVLVDDVAIGTFSPASASFQQFTTNSFQVSGSTAKIEFRGSPASSDAASALDQISLVPSAANASFEQPEVGSSFSYAPSLSGFSFNGGTGIAGNGSSWGFDPAPDGDQVAFLQSGQGNFGTISQVLSGLTAGASYRLSFSLAQRPGYAINPVIVRANDIELGTFSPASSRFEQFTTKVFQATGPTAKIEFVGTPTSDDAATALDSVVASAVSQDSFEQPRVGGYFAYQPTLPGFTFGAGTGIAANGSPWGFTPAPDGDQAAFLQSGPGFAGSILRSLSGLVAGASYKISISLAQRPGYAANPVTVSADDVVLGTFTPSSTTFEPFTIPAFVAKSSTPTIKFLGAETNADVASGLDLIVIEPSASSAASTPPAPAPAPTPAPTPPPPAPAPAPAPAPTPPPPPPPPPNSPPVTGNDTLQVQQCATATVNVIANDSDAEGNVPLTVLSISEATGGAATVFDGTSISYTSTGGLTRETLEYTVQDSLGASSTGSLEIQVTGEQQQQCSGTLSFDATSQPAEGLPVTRRFWRRRASG